MTTISYDKAGLCISQGQVGIIPTDTVYGLVCSATLPQAVERVYRIKSRDSGKPCIVLVPSIEDIAPFGITLTPEIRALFERSAETPTSIVLTIEEDRFPHLTRGSSSIAFRIPTDEALHTLLVQTGPLIAPSANPQGSIPATSVRMAHGYFADSVDFYVDGGIRDLPPSQVIVKKKDGDIGRLR